MIKFLDLKAVNDAHDGEIRQAIDSVLQSGWYLQGQALAAFEEQYARYTGTAHAVGCANGLDALTLIYRAYIEMGRLAPGDEVLVPANTYIASILAITENGLRAVPVEPRPDTLEIDEEQLQRAITPRTRSLLLVHLYGRCAYTPRIAALCRRHNLLLVEDNAQAHGAFYTAATGAQTTAEALAAHCPRTGSLGHAAGHSFYPGKNLGALGDGGCVTTDDQELASVVRALGNYGSERKYVFAHRGRNSRLDELQAAVLSVKLRHLDADNARRRRIASIYYSRLAGRIGLPTLMPDAANVYHLFPVIAPEGQRDALQQQLAATGVQTLIHYPIPFHRQRCYEAEYGQTALPVTEMLSRCELSLPISPVMKEEEALKVAEALEKALGS